MSDQDPLDAWTASVRERMVPAGFTEAVMAGTDRPTGFFDRLWRRPLVRAATWLIAGCVLAARLAAAFAFFILG